MVLIGAGCTGAVAAIAMVAAWLVDRWVPAARREANNEVAGMLFSIIGVVYAILLTFVTIAVWETSSAAEDSTRNEAHALLEVNRYGVELADGGNLQALVRRYATVVIGDEWPRLQAGEDISGDGARLIDAMWAGVDGHEAATDSAVLRQAEVRAVLRELGEAREVRLSTATSGLPVTIWGALIASSVLVVVNSLLFGVPGRGSYVAMVGILAAVSALLLYTVYQLEFPFQRGEQIGPDVFDGVLHLLTP
ncbi:bestrophin-like domain [Catenuloplanes japonicus]|uniref:bestrophin-like domain n=1 Tax=Catenuloplanes japonicus TaxID=33876 RepID=UPI0005263C57|nr:DUF4239 domain-containing protein [Catenuloplanes japonicus]